MRDNSGRRCGIWSKAVQGQAIIPPVHTFWRTETVSIIYDVSRTKTESYANMAKSVAPVFFFNDCEELDFFHRFRALSREVRTGREEIKDELIDCILI